jgi:hypothetical protein
MRRSGLFIAVLTIMIAGVISVGAQDGADDAPTLCIAPDVAAAARAACADEAACEGADGALTFGQWADETLTIRYGDAIWTPLARDTAVAAPEIVVRNPSNLPLNLRNAPGTFGAVVETLARGESLTARGRSADNAWLYVALSDGSAAWIAASVVAADGDLTTLVVVEDGDALPATAPAIPAFTLEVGDDCGGVLLHRVGESPARVDIDGTRLAFAAATVAITRDERGLSIAVIDGDAEISAGDTVTSYTAGDRVWIGEVGMIVASLAALPTDAPLSALPESVAICVAADGTRPTTCAPTTSVEAPSPLTTTDALVSTPIPAPSAPIAPNTSYAHQFLPQGQSVWQAYTGADNLSGACESPPIAACDHLSAVVTNPDGSIGWRGQEPQYYRMTPIGADQFIFSGRNGLNNATISMNFTFGNGAWSGTMQYVFDTDPDCTHTFYYTASRLR